MKLQQMCCNLYFREEGSKIALVMSFIMHKLVRGRVTSWRCRVAHDQRRFINLHQATSTRHNISLARRTPACEGTRAVPDKALTTNGDCRRLYRWTAALSLAHAATHTTITAVGLTRPSSVGK